MPLYKQIHESGDGSHESGDLHESGDGSLTQKNTRRLVTLKKIVIGLLLIICLTNTNIFASENALSSIKKIESDIDGMIILKDNGDVWGLTGDLGAYRLGVSTRYNRYIEQFFQIKGINDVVDIAMDEGAAFFLKKDGSVLTLNISTKNKSDSYYLPMKIEGLTDIIEIVSIDSELMALDNLGNVWIASVDNTGNCNIKALDGVKNVIQLSKRAILTEEGQVYVLWFGASNKLPLYPQLYLINELSDKNIIDIRMSFYPFSLLALSEDGNVFTLGGVLGNGDVKDDISIDYWEKAITYKLPINNVAHIESNVGHNVIVTKDGKLYEWGPCTFDKGCSIPQFVTQFNIEDISYIHSGAGYIFIILKDGTIVNPKYTFGDWLNYIAKPGMRHHLSEEYKKYPNINIAINGKMVREEFASPLLIENKAYIPAWSLIEAMGGTIEWMDNYEKAKITVNDKQLTMNIDVINLDRQTYLDEKEIECNTSIKMIEGNPYLPVRFIVETFGGSVTWYEKIWLAEIIF